MSHPANLMRNVQQTHDDEGPITVLAKQFAHIQSQQEHDAKYDRAGISFQGTPVTDTPKRHLLNAWQRGDLVPPAHPPTEHFVTPLLTAHLAHLSSAVSEESKAYQIMCQGLEHEQCKKEQTVKLLAILTILLILFIFVHLVKL